MSCYHPLKAIRKPEYKQKKDGGFYRPILYVPLGTEIMPYDFVDTSTGEMTEEKTFLIPCGRCLGCRLDYSKAWANRMTMESITMTKEYKPTIQGLFSNDLRWQANEMEFEPWFITFTYDDQHLPRGCVNEDGSQHFTLFMKDFQDFMKRLRVNRYRQYGYEGSIKYYYAGEYGDTTMRPHYHAIMWYLPLHKLRYYAKTALGDILYNDPEITDLWGKGHVVIARANWNTCAYTARYVMKKQNMTYSEQCELFGNIGISAPYVRMSRNPGIGIEFFEKHKDEIYTYDQIVLPANKKGEVNTCKPPHIFDTKYGEEFPEELKVIKENRQKTAEIAQRNLLEKVEKTHEAYLKDAEQSKRKTLRSLRRFL